MLLQCLCELVNEAPFLYTAELDNIASLCFRAMDSSNYDVRCDVAKLLGRLLAATQTPQSAQGRYSTSTHHQWHFHGRWERCILISAASLGVYYFFVVDSVCPSVCLFVTLLPQIDSSFLFLDGIEPFFGHHLYMWHSTKRCSSTFELGPLTPKINPQNCLR